MSYLSNLQGSLIEQNNELQTGPITNDPPEVLCMSNRHVLVYFTVLLKGNRMSIDYCLLGATGLGIARNRKALYINCIEVPELCIKCVQRLLYQPVSVGGNYIWSDGELYIFSQLDQMNDNVFRFIMDTGNDIVQNYHDQ